MTKRIPWGLLLVFLLVACSGGQPQTTPTWTAAPTLPPPPPSATTAPATDTPIPATATTAPTLGPTDTPAPTATLLPQIFGPDNFPAGVNPLTGLTVANPALLERRPVAIKINIVPRNFYRPPWGLSLADIVFDYYHNDGYARFHAIFYGNDASLAGPIRSGRLLDNELVRMYKSNFAYGSADQQINQRFFSSEYNTRLVLEGNSIACPPTAASPLCRFEPAGHDHLLADTSMVGPYLVARGVDNSRQNLNGMAFNSATPAGGGKGSQIFVQFSIDNYLRWDYDPATGKYLRFQDAVMAQPADEQFEPLTDRLTNQQVSADNVVILLVPHVYVKQPPAEIIDILLSGVGKAYAFRDGQVYEVTWNRPTFDSVVYLTFPDGTRFPFKPGNTWFEVMVDKSQITQPGDGAWRFDFVIPQ